VAGFLSPPDNACSVGQALQFRDRRK